MVSRYLYLFVFILGIISAVSFVSGQITCNPDLEACGTPITNAGYGAVQLCENCFICGLQDGVCPEDFASNETETIINRTIVLMRTDNTRINVYNEPVIYNSGNLACAEISGDCQEIEELDGNNWVSSSVTCSNPTPTGEYTALRAVCQNVPKTAGCYNCPDPDCRTTVRGVLFNNVSGEGVATALIVFRASNPNSNQEFQVQTDAEGAYQITDAARGYFNYTCLKAHYEPYEGQTLLIRNENIVDCPMRPAACKEDPQCSMESVAGQDICRSICEGESGCVFDQEIEVERMDQDNITVNASTLCDGRVAGSRITVARHNETHVTTIQCCTGIKTFVERPQLQISGNVSDLITRDYVRILDDDQVTAKIIVYKTD